MSTHTPLADEAFGVQAEGPASPMPAATAGAAEERRTYTSLPIACRADESAVDEFVRDRDTTQAAIDQRLDPTAAVAVRLDARDEQTARGQQQAEASTTRCVGVFCGGPRFVWWCFTQDRGGSVDVALELWCDELLRCSPITVMLCFALVAAYLWELVLTSSADQLGMDFIGACIFSGYPALYLTLLVVYTLRRVVLGVQVIPTVVGVAVESADKCCARTNPCCATEGKQNYLLVVDSDSDSHDSEDEEENSPNLRPDLACPPPSLAGRAKEYGYGSLGHTKSPFLAAAANPVAPA